MTKGPPTPAPAPSEQEVEALRRLARDVSLAQGSKQGAAWIGSTKILAQAIQFAFSIINARLLFPEDFGHAAVAISVMTFAQLFTDLGITAGLVQFERLNERVLSSAFWLNVVTGLLLTSVVATLSFPLASFFGQPEIQPLLMVGSLTFVLSCGVVPLALLERTFNFHRVAIVEFCSTVTGLFVVPVAAVAGLGAMSLILGPLVQVTLSSLGYWVTARWKPHFMVSFAAINELWRFSRGIVGFNVVTYWSRNTDTILLGKTAEPAELGEYNRAYTVTLMPVTQMSIVVGRVLFPALARQQDDPERLGRSWTRGILAALTLMLPVSVTMAAAAPSLILVIYGERWEGMTPVFILLALAAVPGMIAASTWAAYRALGKAGLLFRLGLATSALSILGIIAGLPWGAEGVAAGLLVQAWVALPVLLVPLARLVNLDRGAFFLATLKAAIPSAALAAAQLGAGAALHGHHAGVILLGQLAAGGVAFSITFRVTAPDTWNAVAGRIREFRRTRRPDG